MKPPAGLGNNIVAGNENLFIKQEINMKNQIGLVLAAMSLFFASGVFCDEVTNSMEPNKLADQVKSESVAQKSTEKIKSPESEKKAEDFKIVSFDGVEGSLTGRIKSIDAKANLVVLAIEKMDIPGGETAGGNAAVKLTNEQLGDAKEGNKVKITIKQGEVKVAKLYDKTVKILSVGNSFSEDAISYLHDFAAADNVEMKNLNLYISGCSLDTHWEKASGNIAAYVTQLNGVRCPSKSSIKEALESDDWDYVTLQQASGDSGIESTYTHIEDLALYIRNLAPHAELLIHQTWAYETGCTSAVFINVFHSSQAEMFNALKSAYDKTATRVGNLPSFGGKKLRILPCGEAFQNARANTMFNDTLPKFIPLNRGATHASLTHGRYLLSATWYGALTGKDITLNTFVPAGITEPESAVLKKAAHDALVSYGW